MKRRQFILLSGGAGAGSLSVGTGAFSSVTADRSVSVNVVDDDEAYLGLEQLPEGTDVSELTVDDQSAVVKVTNLFPNAIDLNIDVIDDEHDLDEPVSDRLVSEDEVDLVGFSNAGREGYEVRLGTGNSGDIEVTCDEEGDAVLALSFEGKTDGGSVNKTRAYDIVCEQLNELNESSPPLFTGNGNIELDSSWGTVDVYVLYFENDRDTWKFREEPDGDPHTWDTNSNKKWNQSKPDGVSSSGQISAILFTDTGAGYYNPRRKQDLENKYDESEFTGNWPPEADLKKGDSTGNN